MPSGKEFFRRARQSNAARRKKARRLGVLTIFKQAHIFAGQTPQPGTAGFFHYFQIFCCHFHKFVV